ncbi:MAG TPA: FkbM family methyltransferase [Alphaproteobacteria bacterium]|jgi:FkbM family methyltransferase
MSKTIANGLTACVRFGSAWMKPYRRAMTQSLISANLSQSVTVGVPNGNIRFVTPSARSLHSPWELFTEEPETIRWLDGLPAGDVLWDIGANIGVYTLYAAKARGLQVVAFEPSAASYAVLTRNIEVNDLSGRIDAYCIAFDDCRRLDHLRMANTEAGHSMHAFGQDHTIQGAVATIFRQAVMGFAIDDFCQLFAPPMPRHIKLDVDSIELKILQGAAKTLAEHVESVLVEIDGDDQAATGRDIGGFLLSLGFREDEAFTAQETRRNVLFRRQAA